MTTTENTENEGTKQTSHGVFAFREHLEDGVDTLLRVHKDWLEAVCKQQAHMFSALRDGVGQMEKVVGQATDRYRHMADTWGSRLSDAVHRTSA